MTEEQTLWQAVITQAMLDTFTASEQKARDDVEYWVGSPEFYDVCRYAGMSASRVEATFARIFAQKDLAKRKELVKSMLVEKRRIRTDNVVKLR